MAAAEQKGRIAGDVAPNYRRLGAQQFERGLKPGVIGVPIRG